MRVVVGRPRSLCLTVLGLFFVFVLPRLAQAESVIASVGALTHETQNGNQRKLFWDGTRWWAFYHKDTGLSLFYSYSSGADPATSTWTESSVALPTGSNSFYEGGMITVYYDGSTTFLVSYDGPHRQDYFRGSISGTTIAWTGTPSDLYAANIGFAGGSFPYVLTLDSSNSVLYGAWDANGNPAVYKSTDPFSSSFSDTGAQWSVVGSVQTINDYVNDMSVHGLASGHILVITDDFNVNPSIRWELWNGASWSTFADLIAAGSGVSRWNWASIKISGADVRFLGQDTASSFTYQKFDGASWTTLAAPSWPAGGLAANSNVALAVDSGGAVYACVIRGDANNSVSCNQYSGAAWGGWVDVETGAKTRSWIETGFNLATNTIGILYTEVNGSNYDFVASSIQAAAAGSALTVTKSGTGGGSVTSSPSGISCGAACSASFASGTSVTLTATADPGSTFGGFSGGCVSATTTCAFTLTASASVTAAFNGATLGAPPTALSAADTPADQGKEINLAWTPSTSAGIIEQRIYRGTTSGSYGLIKTFADNTTSSYTDSDPSLVDGTTYYYVVRAFDGTNESANSNQAGAVPIDNIPPIPPANLAAADHPSDQGGAIDLSWTASASPDVVQQRIYRSTNSGGPYTLIQTFSDNTTTSYTDPNATLGPTYYYIVKAFDGTQESANSNEASMVSVSDLLVTYSYEESFSTNPIGRLTSVNDASGVTKFYYDSMGRANRTDKIVDGATYTTQTGFDSLGRVISIGYPDNTSISYNYNGPLPYQVYDATTTYVQYTGYNALGQPAGLTYGDGVNTSYTYSNIGNGVCPQQNFRLCTIITNAAGGATPESRSYGYDAVGNVTTLNDGVNGNQTFGYDELDRLTTANGPYGAINYIYDTIGDMTYNSQMGNYGYPPGPNSALPHAVQTAGAYSYNYDLNGNMTQATGQSGVNRTIAYDIENRPTQITAGGAATTFVYDSGGGRVKKTTGGITTLYIGKLYECINTACSKFIFAGGRRIAMAGVGTTDVYYYHPDHLGSTSVVTQNGGVVENLAYYPYGASRVDSGISVDHKYTSQELDAGTGLYFYNARYYDPALGRFISPDTIVPDPANPQAFNRYSYVLNNPLVYTDPSGHWSMRHLWHEITRPQNAVAVQLLLPGVGTVLLTQSKAGRNILAGEVIAGTAVATFYCGGCGAVAAGALQGALVGEGIGAYSAHRSGGDMLTGVVKGGLIGGAIGGAFAEAGVLTKGMNPVIQIGAKGMVGGTASKLLGGSFEKGFLLASAAATAYWGYNEMVGFDPNPMPGENNLQDGQYNARLNGGRPPVGSNVVGLNDGENGFWSQGGPVSNVGNAVPGINATAGLHDFWMNNMPFNAFTNVGTMAPAVAVSYGALASVPLSPLLMEQAAGDSNGF